MYCEKLVTKWLISHKVINQSFLSIIRYIYTEKWARSDRKMISSLKDWIQCDIIKQSKNLNQSGKNKIPAIIPTEYQNYLSTAILKHVNLLAELNKLCCVHILKMTLYNTSTVLKYTYAQWPHQKLVTNKRCQILLSNYQGNRVHNTIIQLFQFLICWWIINRNNSPKTSIPRLKEPSVNWHR